MNEETTKEKILELIGTDPRSVEWAKMPYSFWAKMPYSFWAKMPDSVWAKMPDSVWANMPDSVWANMPYSVWAKMPDSVWANMPDSVWAKMPYSFWAKMPDSVWANMPEIKKAINEPGLKVENLYSKILASIKTDGCALDQSDWECGSTCCIGGWTKHHAGEAGQKLKELIGYRGTAMIIHRKSRPGAPFPNYNGSTPNDATMAYIKARAAEETK